MTGSDSTARDGAAVLAGLLDAIAAAGACASPKQKTREIEGPHTFRIAMRDGVGLVTDIHGLGEVGCAPQPAVVLRTPYNRRSARILATCRALVDLGYIAVAQDCRGTGDSEPESWDYYVREPEDGYDTVEWVRIQPWCDGFIGACGSSYAAQVQWSMATNPAMRAIVPEVSGLGLAHQTARLHMFLNAYSRAVGKGRGKLSIGLEELERQMLPETLATGYFQEPLATPLPAALLERYSELAKLPSGAARLRLWQIYAAASCSERAALLKLACGSDAISIAEMEALPAIFGQAIAHDAHTLPAPSEDVLLESLHAPALLVTGWYDWGLIDAFATFQALERRDDLPHAADTRLIITPSAHSMPGYHERSDDVAALRLAWRTPEIAPLLDAWYRAVAKDSLRAWPKVLYYVLGANAWRSAAAWPPPETRFEPLYLAENGRLALAVPQEEASDSYVYHPDDPTPTLGGSIVSYVYRPGSVDVTPLHARSDVLVYTTPPLVRDLELAGPLRARIHASSSAVDTDFAVRISDVHPDGRAIQLQNGVLRSRYRTSLTEPSLLVPGQIYPLDIDMGAIAIRLPAGHRLLIDITSADFPRFDRHANRIDPGPPLDAVQRIHRGPVHSSHVILPTSGAGLADAFR